MEEEEVDWRLMIPELLYLILEKLPLVPDLFHFSAVCNSWYDAARAFLQKTSRSRAQRQPPLLLIFPPRKGKKSKKQTHHHHHHCLFSIPENKILDFQVSQSVMPSNDQVRCCGSSHGWLFFNTKNCFTMSNPFIRRIIQLPPIRYGVHTYEVLNEEQESKLYSEHVRKVILSCDPVSNPNSYEAVAIFRDFFCLAIFKAGDEDWTFVNCRGLEICGFLDVIYHEGVVHVIDLFMALWKFKLSGIPFGWAYNFDKVSPGLSSEEVTYFVRHHGYTYLVESSKGDLVCVLRVYDSIRGKAVTTNFRIFRLENDNAIENNDQHLKLKEWIEIDSLHEDALFLGDNYSTAINVGEIPGYQKNSIYYTYHEVAKYHIRYQSHGCEDIGIFNLENRSFGSHYAGVPMPPAIWIVPSLVIPKRGNQADQWFEQA